MHREKLSVGLGGASPGECLAWSFVQHLGDRMQPPTADVDEGGWLAEIVFWSCGGEALGVMTGDVVPGGWCWWSAVEVSPPCEAVGLPQLILRRSASLAPGAVDAARAEMETNFFGSMRVARAFAPVLRDNGGGALVNVLSVLSFISMPQGATYSASKAAAWSLTNALRIELRRQGTLVVAVHAGFIDTDMAAGVSGEKISPQAVAAQIVAAIEADAEEVLADATSETVKAALPNDLTALYPALQAQWDAEAISR